jgi:hypothetical protein
MHDELDLSRHRRYTRVAEFKITSIAAVRRLIPRGTERCYGAGGEEMATSSLHLTDGGAAMPQPNDLSRSLVALDSAWADRIAAAP